MVARHGDGLRYSRNGPGTSTVDTVVQCVTLRLAFPPVLGKQGTNHDLQV